MHVDAIYSRREGHADGPESCPHSQKSTVHLFPVPDTCTGAADFVIGRYNQTSCLTHKQSIILTTPSAIEIEYQTRLDAMSPAERVSRSAAMFAWTREQLARQISAEQGPMPEEILKWQVALRLYGNEPGMRKMIEQRLADVSG